MEKAFRVASKIADKIVIMDKDPQTIETAATIMAGHVEDPVSKLKELGIDITPELEELKQVFAEISGKKPKKTKKAKRRKQLTVLKSCQVQNSTEFDTSQGEELRVEAQKLLGILQGLKFANYSTEAVERAVEGLENELSAFLENPKEKLELIGLYSTAVYLLREGKFEKLEKFLREL